MAVNMLLLADDLLIAEDKISDIKNGFSSDFQTISYDLEEDSIYTLCDELTTVSLFDEPIFVIVKGSEQLLLPKNERAFLTLLKAMNVKDSKDVLILLFLSAVDGSGSAFKKLKQFATVIECRLKNVVLSEYIQKKAADQGFEIEAAAVSLLESYTTSAMKLHNDLQMLFCYCWAEKKITRQDVLQMISSPLEDNVYALMDYVLAGNKKWMMKGLKDLKLKSVQPSTLISLLLNKFQEMYNVQVLLKSGLKQSALADLLGVSPGRAYYMIKNAKAHSAKAVLNHLKLLNDLDYQIKTGRIDQNLGLELYFLK